MNQSTELTSMLTDMAGRLFDDLGKQTAITISASWEAIEAFGLANLLLPEHLGGFDGSWQDAGEIFRLLGEHVIPLPIGETLIARHVLHRCAHDIPFQMSQPMSISHSDDLEIVTEPSSTYISGTIKNVPWGGGIDLLLSGKYQGRHFLAIVPASTPHQEPQRNVNTGTPLQDFNYQKTPLVSIEWLEQPINLKTLGALLRTGQMAGAMNRLLSMSVTYCHDRQQFGRPLGKFQVVQHEIARLAEQTAAVNCASESACLAVDTQGISGNANFEIAAAKLRANLAVASTTSIAHQVHGAIGFTVEHTLHQYTQRLFGWRSEFGNDRYWSNQLGSLIMKSRDNSLWSNLTARGDLLLKGYPLTDKSPSLPETESPPALINTPWRAR